MTGRAYLESDSMSPDPMARPVVRRPYFDAECEEPELPVLAIEERAAAWCECGRAKALGSGFCAACEAGENMTVTLQLSINQSLMKRLDALEAEMVTLRKTVKNLQHMMPV